MNDERERDPLFGEILWALIVILAVIGLLALVTGKCSAQTTFPNEADLTKVLAVKYNAAGVTLWDKSRADLANETYAFEVDWAPKWKEAVGQALYYGLVLNKRPAIILITMSGDEDKFVYRCQAVCVAYGIALYVEPASGLVK